MPDLLVVGVGMRFEQLPRHQHEAWRAEAALSGAGFEEGTNSAYDQLVDVVAGMKAKEKA